jgi:osmotically inducible protein OsmC
VLKEVDGAPTLARIELSAEGTVPGIDEDEFGRLAEEAKKDCPVSRALGAVPEIRLEATLKQ